MHLISVHPCLPSWLTRLSSVSSYRFAKENRLVAGRHCDPRCMRAVVSGEFERLMKGRPSEIDSDQGTAESYASAAQRPTSAQTGCGSEVRTIDFDTGVALYCLSKVSLPSDS